MKCPFDTIKQHIEYAREFLFSKHCLLGDSPNGKTINYITIECNGGLYFFHHHTNEGCTEITTSKFIELIELDQDKFEKQGWL